MARIVVDTNVVLSFLTDRNERQQARAARLFSSSAAGDLEILLHQAVISESVYVMTNQYAVSPARVAAILRDLLALPGVMAIDALVWSTVLGLWPDRIGDFGDACLAAATTTSGFDSLATFDAAFAKRVRRHGLATYW